MSSPNLEFITGVGFTWHLSLMNICLLKLLIRCVINMFLCLYVCVCVCTPSQWHRHFIQYLILLRSMFARVCVCVYSVMNICLLKLLIWCIIVCLYIQINPVMYFFQHVSHIYHTSLQGLFCYLELAAR